MMPPAGCIVRDPSPATPELRARRFFAVRVPLALAPVAVADGAEAVLAAVAAVWLAVPTDTVVAAALGSLAVAGVVEAPAGVAAGVGVVAAGVVVTTGAVAVSTGEVSVTPPPADVVVSVVAVVSVLGDVAVVSVEIVSVRAIATTGRGLSAKAEAAQMPRASSMITAIGALARRKCMAASCHGNPRT
jgi:hypothetical protein